MLPLPTAILVALLASQVRPRPEVESIVAQAGELLTVTAPGNRPTAGGTVRAPSLTGGVDRRFDSVEGVEFDAAARTVKLRVPPRESGPVDVRFETTGLPRTELATRVVVTPPNLKDGIRVDGIHDAFESALVLGHAQGAAWPVPMFDATTMVFDGVIGAEYSVTTDSTHVYLRVAWTDATQDREFDLGADPSPRRHDLLAVRFDSDGDGTFEAGEDCRVVFSFETGSSSLDQHAVDAFGNGASDATTDGVGRMAWDAANSRWTAELLLPRAPDANGEDAALDPNAAPRFDLVFFDGFGTAPIHPRLGGLYGMSTDASGWGVFPLPPPLPAHAHAPLSPSGGTFVCISSHEHAKGEIYELDFATGNLVRLTFNDRWEDWVSVAPDGSFAVYGASPSQNDFTGYEIWKWERATGLEKRLTFDQRLDGHPAIAPDNQTIAFVSFTPIGVDLFTMDRNGGNRTRVTNDAVEQNDPEWTKDGALVIKTTEWTGLEQLAVMNLSGAIERRLTANANSDHDPFVSPDGAWVLYERFEGAGVWNADLNLTSSTPWTVRMVRRDGSAHRVLVDDGLVNWLPVMAPLGSDGAIAYFCTAGLDGVEMRLVDRFGVDRGRFLPRESRVRYMDWK